MKMPKTNILALLALLLLAAFFQCSVAAEEKTDGDADGASDVLDLSGEGITVKQPDFDKPLADSWSSQDH